MLGSDKDNNVVERELSVSIVYYRKEVEGHFQSLSIN